MVTPKIFRNKQVKIDKNALVELQQFLQLQNTIEQLACIPGFFDTVPEVAEVVNTPDFHKGAGIPIGTVMTTAGFVVPQAMGSDINCGMRLYTTTLTDHQVQEKLTAIEQRVRHIFFEGARDLAMNKLQRQSIFHHGLIGVWESSRRTADVGLWRYYNRARQEQDLDRVESNGSLPGKVPPGLDSFIGHSGLSYDNQCGSIGGGNHFVEVQTVSAIADKKTAYAWGLKENQVVIMIHSGSLSIGQHVGLLLGQLMRSIFPAHIKHPDNGIYVLPDSELHRHSWQQFWQLVNGAANFAFANRLFLGLMMEKALTEVLGEFECSLLYDAPHNLVWPQTIENKKVYLHRKGACPARGIAQMQNSPFAYYGEPVFIPGSMGAPSFILAGLGNRHSMFSASHGAGRSLSRSAAIKTTKAQWEESIRRLTVITPIDPKRPDIKSRSDILKKWEEELKAEAPYAYKEITPVIQTHVDHDMAKVVAVVDPIFTVKGAGI